MPSLKLLIFNTFNELLIVILSCNNVFPTISKLPDIFKLFIKIAFPDTVNELINVVSLLNILVPETAKLFLIIVFPFK